MKKSILSLMIAATGLLMACGGSNTESAEADDLKTTEEMSEATSSEINTDKSSVVWKGTMVGVYSHEGTLSFSKGILQTSGDKITGGSFTVDMTSMNPTDENYNAAEEKTPEKLVGHLSSPDFFDVANHPTASFEITGSEGSTVKGNMTIRGISNEEVVKDVKYNATSNTWTGNLNIDRKKYDVAWDSPMKDMVLNNQLELTLNLAL